MSRIEDAASVLRQARVDRQPCPPIRTLLAGGSIEDAYAVQRCNTEMSISAGRRRIGWKVGLTNPAVQQQLGVDQPDFGPLFADESVIDGCTISSTALLQPRAEAEVAFVLGRDLDVDQITALDVLRATSFVLPAIEIVDSRVAGWDITILDTIADDASTGCHVLGTRATPLTAVDLAEVEMTMTSSGDTVSSGSGRDCLSHPVNAVVWLANTLRSLGQPLREGDLVLSGALGPMATVTPGQVFTACIAPLGTVRAVFDTEDE